MTRKNNHIGQLIFSILLCEGTGALSALLSGSGRTPWFDSLEKPEWNPPSYLFGPVWTCLYLLMGISLWLVRKSNAAVPLKNKAYNAFGMQLLLNFCWSIIFFRFHLISVAFAEILILWILINITIFRFAAISKTAAWLLVPYVSWVSFASLLNFAIWMMNR